MEPWSACDRRTRVLICARHVALMAGVASAFMLTVFAALGVGDLLWVAYQLYRGQR